jgi:hypothetical protein
MKRTLSLIAMSATLWVALSALAAPPGEDSAAAATASAPSPADPPIPATEPQRDPPATTQDPPASVQSDGNAAGTSQNTRLAALVPSGMSPQEACTGFKSTRECAAALHAAQNLNIPFADLKAKVTAGNKLGPAIKALKPEAHVKSEVRRAEQQARSDTEASRG